ncbi:cytochrome c biogenesis CcdA family protein [Haloplanus halophilus]|uniref:cytochrome c biogenesis CcdA family protein n=1 Tax=Haloplanus halophilus TaxID=2949993 RepID=UPI0020420765|nr:cytochrome c biogenesis protein CcdA [Haloplanus sp. GDY1]
MGGLALPALFGLAFSAGTVTFFAPCAFPLLPGYLSYFLGDTASRMDDEATAGRLTRRVRGPLARAGLISVAAGLGITLVYVGLAGTTVALGARALADIAVLEVVVGGLFLLVGGAMALGWRGGSLVHVRLPERRRSVVGFFLFGVLYAGAAAGCTAPLFIAVVAKGLASAPAVGVGIAVAYALGMSVVLTTLTGVSALGGSSAVSILRDHTERIYRASGVLLAASGVAEMYYFFYGFPEVVPR